MKHLIPHRVELAIFAGLAVVCGAVVSALGNGQDLALSVVSIPIFVAASIMGMKRSGQWSSLGKPPAVPTEASSPDD